MTDPFYVYILFRPWNCDPCYVGKGKGDRWKHHFRRPRNPHLAAIIKRAGGDLPVVILHEGLDETTALAYEVALIAAIGRKAHGGSLVNLTDGGEGTAGAIMTPDWRAHRSAKAKECWADDGYRAKLSAAHAGNKKRLGAKHTEAWKAANAERMKGNQRTLGLRHTDEAKAKMSAHRRGLPKSPEHRAAIAAASTGKVFTPERIANMRAGKLRAAANRAARVYQCLA